MPQARRHESWTIDIILDPQTDVHRALRELSAGMPDRVAALIDGRHRLGYLARCISGTLDADRCDYLLRDSHMTGVGYGVYDLDWLLQALAFGESPAPGEWVLAIEGRKGLPPIEGFFLARQFMYQQVYHHKATRAAEALIQAIFVRVAELVQDGAQRAADPDRVAQRGNRSRRSSCRTTWRSTTSSCSARFARGRTPQIRCSPSSRAAWQRRNLPKTVPLKPGAQRRVERSAGARA